MALRPGRYFLQGNEALAEGAIAAGCRFFAFYPITPASEIAHWLARRLPEVGGVYIQMEDEIGSIMAVIGASWAGAKAMTATSGPGFSLMQEGIGYAVMTETPCVIADIQRAGPSTGSATFGMQGDVMQAQWGSHGHYPAVALAPSSAQEMFDFTVEAFNLAEQLRHPIILLADEPVAHTREVVDIPEQVEVVERKRPTSPEEPFFLRPEVAPMPRVGDGFAVSVTGSTHDERGMRRVGSYPPLDHLVRTLMHKIEQHRHLLPKPQHLNTEDADLILLTYGGSFRPALHAMRLAREQGLRVGILRLTTVWPFPYKEVVHTAQHAGRILVVEMNLGQIALEVERVAGKYAQIELCDPKPFGTFHDPRHILKTARQLLERARQ